MNSSNKRNNISNITDNEHLKQTGTANKYRIRQKQTTQTGTVNKNKNGKNKQE